MQINKDNLTIVIVTIKSQNVIDNCLKSIDPEVNKIIIENSNDKEFINNIEKRYKNVKCFLTGKNLGMGAANNLGIAKTSTRYVMILNPDTELHKDTLKEIFNSSKNLNFAVLSPISDNKEFLNYKIFSKKEQNQKDLIEVDRVDGYAMILDKLKFDNNFFDEKFFLYLENDDLCLRMKNKKENIYVCSKSLISHFGGKAVSDKFFKEIEFSRNWHWSWSKLYFRKKHYGLINAIFSCLPNFVKSLFKCLIYFFINKFRFKVNYLRLSGFYHALINNKSWYRPKFD